MINLDALFNVTYGLYIVCSGDKSLGNGFISNTVMQVTAEPPKFALCCNKDNYTAELIKKTGLISASILHKNSSIEILRHFGYKSGRDFNKMTGMDIKYGETGVPIILNESLAYLEFRLIDTVDAGSHYLFMAELINSGLIDNSQEPLTYDYYRKVKKGESPKNAPTYIDKSKFKQNVALETGTETKYKCNVCGYIYNDKLEDTEFVKLSDDWQCPVCGCGKEDFEQL